MMKHTMSTGEVFLPDTHTQPRQLQVISGGAGQGARHLVSAIHDLNTLSDRFHIEPTYVDPVPAKAVSLVREAADAGVHAHAIEAHVEEILTDNASDNIDRVVVLNLDRPASIAAALRAVAAREQEVLGYLLVATPTAELFGVRFVLRSGEGELVRQAARFFDGLAAVTARSGSTWVIGERGRPEHRATETVYRAWFADHLQANLPKLVADIEPETSPVEITRDGTTTLAAVLIESPTGWREPRVLAEEVAAEPPMPLVRGEDFAILETGPDGVRIHRVRLRVTDGRLAVFDTTGIDPAMVEEVRQREIERARIATEAIARRAERSTISRLNPAYTTD
jgi:hypothetical protein